MSDAVTRTRSVDHDAAESAKLMRAMTDPIVLHPSNQSALDQNDRLKEWIAEARIEAAEASPAGEPVEQATWPEVAAYCMSASLVDARFAHGKAAAFYQYAFIETIEEFAPSTDTPSMIDGRPDLDDYRRAELDRFRRDIKHDLDRQFLDERYDDMIGADGAIPKAFWSDPLPADPADSSDGSESDETDDQRTLGSYVEVSAQ
jgi:hypothetical protein